MKLLIDGDSIIYSICYSSQSLNDCYFKWDNKISGIKSYFKGVTCVTDFQTIIYIQEKGQGFRKELYSDYKSTRTTTLPPYFHELKSYVRDRYTVTSLPGWESDDLIAMDAPGNAIAYIDKDLKQISSAKLHINYKKYIHFTIDEDQARYNFYSQFIIGDVADNVQGIKGKGEKFVEKYFQGGNYFYKTLKLYIEEYGTIQGWKQFRKNYTLLRLGHLSHIDH